MGFHRTSMPTAIDRAEVTAIVARFVAEEITTLVGTDPFGLDHDCLNPAGHDPIASCGEIVCCHCARIFWR